MLSMKACRSAGDICSAAATSSALGPRQVRSRRRVFCNAPRDTPGQFRRILAQLACRLVDVLRRRGAQRRAPSAGRAPAPASRPARRRRLRSAPAPVPGRSARWGRPGRPPRYATAARLRIRGHTALLQPGSRHGRIARSRSGSLRPSAIALAKESTRPFAFDGNIRRAPDRSSPGRPDGSRHHLRLQRFGSPARCARALPPGAPSPSDGNCGEPSIQ